MTEKDYLYQQANLVLGICGGAIIMPLDCHMMNQVHIGVIVPGMENGRIQPFQVQYTITQRILLIGIQILLNVSVMEPQKPDENKGTHILHTVLYYENI